MGKLSTVIAFVTGAAVGGVSVWYITKERYAQLAEEEISSVKEAYAKMESKKKKAEEAMRKYQGTDDEAVQEGPTPAVAAKVAEKGSIAEYAKRVQEGAPMEYSKTVVPPKGETASDQRQTGTPGEFPYVISPEDFNELDGYTPVSLTYFADGVLADEHGVIVDDVEEIIGDGLNHFGEWEDDSVFVRNDAKRCDYEILRDERTYEEFRKTLPSNI